MNKKMTRLIATTFFVLCSALALIAQSEQEGREAKPAAKPEPTPVRRLSGQPAADRRNPFGFSLGFLGWYDSNVMGIQTKKAVWAITPNPRVFFNVGTRRSVLHLDYQYYHRLYPDHRELDSNNHEATVEYTYQPTRRTTILLHDYGRHGPNDILAFTQRGITMPSEGQQQFFFDLKNMWSNNATASIAHKSKKNRFEIAGESQIYHYNSQPDQNTHSFRARASEQYEFAKHWSVVGEAWNEWVYSATKSRDGRILRLLGGLIYRPDKDWEIGAKAGTARVSLNTSGEDNTPTYEAYVARATRLNRFEIRYSRQPSYQIGLTGLNRSDMVSAFFDQQLGSRLSVNVGTNFYRTYAAMKLDTVGGTAGFDFALHPSLIATFSGHYMYQNAVSSALPQDLKAERYILSGGLYYLFPSAKREQRVSHRKFPGE